MIHVKDMLSVTGYIRGGCSPIGMKKKFPTYIEETAQLYDKITVSAGQRGVQVTLSPETLRGYTDAVFAPLYLKTLKIHALKNTDALGYNNAMINETDL